MMPCGQHHIPRSADNITLAARATPPSQRGQHHPRGAGNTTLAARAAFQQPLLLRAAS